MKTVCLFGNGTSIPYNPKLAVTALTTALREQFVASPSEILKNYAIALDAARNKAGFEDLLGPFDNLAAVITQLPSYFYYGVGELGTRLGNLGLEAGQYTLNMDGIPGVLTSKDWEQWTKPVDAPP